MGFLSRRGIAAVELAILLPFLCFMLVIAVDFSRIFYFTLTVTNCARNGAYYGSTDTVSALDQNGIKTAALNDAGNLDAKQLTVSSARDSSTNPTYVDVTVTYSFKTLTNYPGIPKTTAISRTVRMNVAPLVPN